MSIQVNIKFKSILNLFLCIFFFMTGGAPLPAPLPAPTTGT